MSPFLSNLARSKALFLFSYFHPLSPSSFSSLSAPPFIRNLFFSRYTSLHLHLAQIHLLLSRSLSPTFFIMSTPQPANDTEKFEAIELNDKLSAPATAKIHHPRTFDSEFPLRASEDLEKPNCDGKAKKQSLFANLVKKDTFIHITTRLSLFCGFPAALPGGRLVRRW